MASTRDRPHIQVPTDPWRSREPYRAYPAGGASDKQPGAPVIGRPAHGKALELALATAVRTAQLRRDATTINVRGSIPGVYVEFRSFPGWELALSSMENKRAKDQRKHIEVVAVTEHVEGEGDEASTTQHAAIFVPDGRAEHHLNRLEKYALTTPKATENERRYENIYDRIASLHLAAVRALWTDDTAVFPTKDDEPTWWEVWLRRTDGNELQRFHDFAAQAEIHVGERRLQFDERIVILVRAAPRSLASALDVLGDIAELQRPKEAASFFIRQGRKEQAEWAIDLIGRTHLCGPDAPAVCILDTGVNAGHPLLEGVLASEDCHAYDPSWGTYDHHCHGTEMAGLATYGDLAPVLESSDVVPVTHRLESVKLLPPTGSNDPDLYGAITADAISRPEIQAPLRRRVFSMSITTKDSRDRGQPTSWSSAIDALASGRAFDASDKGLKYIDDGASIHRRLFVISAGNIDQESLECDHLSRSDVESVCDPAQAWNALTVGAYTSKGVISDPTFDGWDPVAAPGELSPWSTTSVVFQNAWPLKPDVVLEGGNVGVDAAHNIDFVDDLGLLTTYFRPNEKLFVPTGMTSAAAAQAARLCASISAEYPDLWPETIRALVIHSAEWTPAMMRHIQVARRKADRARLVRRYGFGVPSLDRALRSARNATTLVVQDAIRPFEEGSMREIHIHELPWPHDELAALGSTAVRVRVTLSYFIEPNPGRRGWQTKHRYQSHGLRFEVKRPTEAPEEFRKRLNKSALDEDEKRPSSDGDGDSWFLGPQARNSGSVHSDILDGLAAEIAERGTIAVFPVTGWWKEQKKRDRSQHGARYALAVSIETDAINADVWTPIANKVGITVEV